MHFLVFSKQNATLTLSITTTIKCKDSYRFFPCAFFGLVALEGLDHLAWEN